MFFSELLPWFPAVVSQNDFLHELFYSFRGSRNDFLICVFGLGDSSDNFNKLVSHQDAWIHSWDSDCSIVDSVELNIDLPSKESALAFFVGDLNLVAEAREIVPTDLRERRSTSQLNKNVFDLPCILPKHIRGFGQVLRVFDKLVAVPELKIMIDAVDSRLVHVLAPILEYTLVLVKSSLQSRCFNFFDVVRNIFISLWHH